MSAGICGTGTWSGSYFAGSYGEAPLAVARQYIENHQCPL